ncbi:hypothetical protein P170DRAFT_152020 [Aspergillus steynii IBT 23096]|uniref:Uncharacterized protein n=1 Tax=Aspergillus steynii IBT 23096 TaxID=1392250 RepID=A0A2I2GCV1_9EURO|nr:uncharacterized protein P170DRAFT_152020 [Aspergillus steynii IBT 23096]PLB50701.1 hypothetical protein P170DRAFT_152020 [Aspergillus steynii IBT 23096]
MDPPDGRIDVAAGLVPFVPFVLLLVRRWRPWSSICERPCLCPPLSLFLVRFWPRRRGWWSSWVFPVWTLTRRNEKTNNKINRKERGGRGWRRPERLPEDTKTGVESIFLWITSAGSTRQGEENACRVLHLATGMCQFTYHFSTEEGVELRDDLPLYPPCVRFLIRQAEVRGRLKIKIKMKQEIKKVTQVTISLVVVQNEHVTLSPRFDPKKGKIMYYIPVDN